MKYFSIIIVYWTESSFRKNCCFCTGPVFEVWNKTRPLTHIKRSLKYSSCAFMITIETQWSKYRTIQNTFLELLALNHWVSLYFINVTKISKHFDLSLKKNFFPNFENRGCTLKPIKIGFEICKYLNLLPKIICIRQ